jgi:hypothetical protein
MSTTLRIAHEDWEKFATASLEGMLVGKGLAIMPDDKDIILEIEQTSFGWKQNNNGPMVLLIPEHTPMCLIESIIHLMEKGYKITVNEITKS